MREVPCASRDKGRPSDPAGGSCMMCTVIVPAMEDSEALGLRFVPERDRCWHSGGTETQGLRSSWRVFCGGCVRYRPVHAQSSRQRACVIVQASGCCSFESSRFHGIAVTTKHQPSTAAGVLMDCLLVTLATTRQTLTGSGRSNGLIRRPECYSGSPSKHLSRTRSGCFCVGSQH